MTPDDKKDLTVSEIDRQNILNNPYALKEVETAAQIRGIPFEGKTVVLKEQAAAARDVEVLLPGDVVGFEELSRNPEELEKGLLTHFVKLTGDELLREGVTLGVARDGRGGIRLRLKEEGVMLDLSDEAVAGVILEHLQPRFRALLEGIVK